MVKLIPVVFSANLSQFLCHLAMFIFVPKQKRMLSIHNGFLFLGVAEQFAIAEAKLRAWASMDDDEDEDLDSEGSPAGDGQTHASFSSSAGTQLIHLSFISFCSLPFTSETFYNNPPTPLPHLPHPHPTCPSILRCSDIMLLPQTAPRQMLPQERYASLSSV